MLCWNTARLIAVMMGSVCALVAAKSEAGVPITKTLDEIQDCDGTESFSGITRWGLLKVCRNMPMIRQVAMHTWVPEMAEISYNPVVVFKAQGDKLGDTTDNLVRIS